MAEYAQRDDRQSDFSEKLESPRRKPIPSHQDRNSRSSEGTVSTMKSRRSYRTARESNATNLTEPDYEDYKPPPYYSKKMVVVGDGGCGKTCLLISYSKGYFPEKYIPTVFENYITYPDPGDGKDMELGLWDTAGQEEYDRLRPLSYPQTDLILICFAIDSPTSLDNVLDKWYPEITHFCPDSPIFLIGLKSDLRTKRTCVDLLKSQGLQPVSPAQGLAVAKHMKAQYMECSSKEYDGVDEIFRHAITTIVAADSRNLKVKEVDVHLRGLRGMSKKKKSRSCKIL